MIYPRTEYLWAAASQQYPLLIDCDAQGCFWITCAKDENQAASMQALHICVPPVGKDGIVTVPFQPKNDGRSGLMVMWDELDICVNIIKKPRLQNPSTPASQASDSDVEYYKARAGGIALCIALLASPHFRTPEDVSKEALDRWRMRNGELEMRPTPGYGGYNPPPPGSNSLTEAARVAASKPLKHNLTDKQVAGIRHAHKAANFSPEDIARAYTLPLPVVRQILDEAESAPA